MNHKSQNEKTEVHRLAIMAKIDQTGLDHVTIDVLDVDAKKIDQKIEKLQKATMRIKQINLATDGSAFPAFLQKRAQLASPKSFSRMNTNKTLTGLLGPNKVMIVDSPEIASIRAQMFKCCNGRRVSQTAQGNYIPHTTLKAWTQATNLPKSTVLTSNIIVVRNLTTKKIIATLKLS